MFKKGLRITAIILLSLLPFSGVLIPYAPARGMYSFSQFLIASIVFVIGALVPAFLISYTSNRLEGERQVQLKRAAWFLLLTGVVFTIPLSMDAPPPADIWLKTGYQEQFRFSMLLLSCLLYFTGASVLLKCLWKSLPAINKLVLLPLITGVVISVYDFSDLFMVTSRLELWVADGKSLDDFFPQYNFQTILRASGRILLYFTASWLVMMMWKQHTIKKWVALLLGGFCTVGILMCIVFMFLGVSFYFPFMVPAIALAPAYWLGIALLNKVE